MKSRTLLTVFAASLLLLGVIARADAPVAAVPAGTKIDVREGDTWTTVTVLKKEGRKYLVRYDDNTEEWVGPDRIRKDGEVAPAATPSPSAADAAPAPANGGGIVVDVSPDSFAELDISNAREPGKPAGAPLKLTVAKPTLDFSSVPIHPLSGDNSIDRLVICADDPSLAIVSCGTVFPEKPEVIRMDLAKQRQLGVATITRGQAVVAAVDEGATIFTCVGMGWDTPIHLWELDGARYRLKANYDPFGRDHHGSGLAMARFVDAGHAIFAANSGETYLVDLRTSKATGQVLGARDSRPYLSPSGQLLGVLSDDGRALVIRTSDFSKIAEFPNAARVGTLAIDPAGTALAYTDGDGAVRVVRIADGTELGVVSGIDPRNDRFDLLSPEKLFVADRSVFDVKTGLPIWIYQRPGGGEFPHMLANGQMLMLVGGEGGASACAVTLPDAEAKAAAASISKESYDLGPGSNVSVKADFSAFGADRDKAEKAITDRLTAAKLNPVDDASAPVRLGIEVVAGPIEQRAYKTQGEAGGLRVITCRSTNLIVSLNLKGKAIWWQSFHFQAGNPLRMTRDGQTLQQAADEAALPQAGGLGYLSFPTFLARGAAPGSPPALGSSDISTRGITPSAQSTLPPPPVAAPAPRAPATPKEPAIKGKAV
jgi:hypothetical protein